MNWADQGLYGQTESNGGAVSFVFDASSVSYSEENLIRHGSRHELFVLRIIPSH